MTTNDTGLSTEQNKTAKVVAPATQAQRDLLDKLNDHLDAKCRRIVKRLEGNDERCLMQVIGVQGVGDQPWVPALLMSHELVQNSGSSEDASGYQQWAFRFELPCVTSTTDLSSALDGLAPRLAKIRKTLSHLNSLYGWVDNHEKRGDIRQVFKTKNLNLVDSTGLEFILCPDRDETLNHERMQACEVTITQPMEDWVMDWADCGGGQGLDEMPIADEIFLRALRPEEEDYPEAWRAYDMTVSQEVETVDDEEVLRLSVCLYAHIPLLEDWDEHELWLTMGEIRATRKDLGMSPRSFQKLVIQGRNPFNCPFDEADLEADDLEILQAYRLHIDASGSFNDAHEAYEERAASKADWARKEMGRQSSMYGTPELVRECIDWSLVADKLQADGRLRLIDHGGSVLVFAGK